MTTSQTGGAKGGGSGWLWVVLAVIGVAWLRDQPSLTPSTPAQAPRMVSPQFGDPASRGGSPTVRRPFIQPDDDPDTTDDESNDQPPGHFGTVSLSICSVDAGNCYTLDGDVSGTTLERVYFPRGGWVDFLGCELDDDLTGDCDDEQGRQWRVDGEY